ncbi:MAG: rod shape-determining protein MreD [Actinomycetota bacterium]
MTLRRVGIIAGALFIGLALQTAFLGRFAILGAKPEVLLLIVVAVAMTEGPTVGLVTGFAAGLMTDSLTDLPDGLTAFVFMAAGLAVGTIRPMFQRPSAWLPAAMVGATTALALALAALLGALLGVFAGTFLRTLVRIILAAVYGMVLTPFLYPLLTRAMVRQRQVLGSVVVRR